MHTERNKAVVRRLIDEVRGQGHIADLDEICATDVVNHAAARDRP